MQRKLFVTILGLAALALLVAAALRARSVPITAHVAYYTLNADIERLNADYEALVAALDTAWQTGQAPAEAAAALRLRLVDRPATLARSLEQIPGSGAQRERMLNSLERLRGPMTTIDDLAASLLVLQADYAESLSLLREQGPEQVRLLRAASQGTLGTLVFQAIAATIEYAAPGVDGSTSDIRRLIVTIERDLRVAGSPVAEAAPLLAAMNRIVETRDGIDSRLDQLRLNSITDFSAGLSEAAAAAYDSATTSADRARTILSVYAVLLLLSVGFIGFRLNGSFRLINRANAELSSLNESLEQRVVERTADLSSALANLRESQVQLVQAEKMSSLGQLVAGISHEINTPLLYLANNASMIEERIGMLRDFVRASAATLSLKPGDFADRREYQERLVAGLRALKDSLRDQELEASIEEVADLNRDSVEGLADLTEMAQSLKDFSRLDRAPTGSFDVHAGIEKTLTIARNIVKHKAEVRKVFAELPPIECSPSKINQVFLNLITNAAQAIEEQGEIVISTRLEGSDRVAISISDTGCGIPEENLQKIRDPFFTTKEVGTGTGLGLSIVDEIVRSHGGELRVESKVGVGSTFTVVLPLRQPRSDLVADALRAEAGVALAEAV